MHWIRNRDRLREPSIQWAGYSALQSSAADDQPVSESAAKRQRVVAKLLQSGSTSVVSAVVRQSSTDGKSSTGTCHSETFRFGQHRNDRCDGQRQLVRGSFTFRQPLTLLSAQTDLSGPAESIPKPTMTVAAIRLKSATPTAYRTKT